MFSLKKSIEYLSHHYFSNNRIISFIAVIFRMRQSLLTPRLLGDGLISLVAKHWAGYKQCCMLSAARVEVLTSTANSR
jgi:hypothetical protein